MLFSKPFLASLTSALQFGFTIFNTVFTSACVFLPTFCANDAVVPRFQITGMMELYVANMACKAIIASFTMTLLIEQPKLF